MRSSALPTPPRVNAVRWHSTGDASDVPSDDIYCQTPVYPSLIPVHASRVRRYRPPVQPQGANTTELLREAASDMLLSNVSDSSLALLKTKIHPSYELPISGQVVDDKDVSKELPEAMDPLDERGAAWLRSHGLTAETAAEKRARHARGEEVDVATTAELAAWHACDLALAAQPIDESDLFDESVLDGARAANAARRQAALAARSRLTGLGVCDEHLNHSPDTLVPLLHEMVYARHVGQSNLAKHRHPPAASFGADFRWPSADHASLPLPADVPLLMLVVACRADEDVSWLARLPSRVQWHVVQVGGTARRDLPTRQQTILRPVVPPTGGAAGDDREGDSGRGGKGAVETGIRGGGERSLSGRAAVLMIDKRKQKSGARGKSPSPTRERSTAAAAAASSSPVGARRGGAASQSEAEAADASTAQPASGMDRFSCSHGFLAYLARAAENEELIELLRDPVERERRVLVVSTERDEVDGSIQATIVAALRKQAQRVMDLFKKWDVDKSGTVDKAEFRRALRALKIAGSDDEFDALHESWDADGGGTIEYGEILKALHAGRRYDQLRKRRADPPIPPMLIFASADPFAHNPRFFDDLELLVRCTAAGRPVPRFLPLGKWRCGERLVHCDPSGAPHSDTLLPIAQCWRATFGSERPVPLWLAHTPGGCFAISREAALSPRGLIGRQPDGLAGEKSPSAFYKRVMTECAVACQAGDGTADPIAGHAFERLWRAIFAGDENEVDSQQRKPYPSVRRQRDIQP